MPRRFRDLVVTVATLLVLLAMITAISPRVRGRIADLTGSSQEWAVPGQLVGGVVATTGQIVSSYAADNTYLFFFMVVAGLLLILMLRA